MKGSEVTRKLRQCTATRRWTRTTQNNLFLTCVEVVRPAHIYESIDIYSLPSHSE